MKLKKDLESDDVDVSDLKSFVKYFLANDEEEEINQEI